MKPFQGIQMFKTVHKFSSDLLYAQLRNAHTNIVLGNVKKSF
jgi:hypothetical protein